MYNVHAHTCVNKTKYKFHNMYMYTVIYNMKNEEHQKVKRDLINSVLLGAHCNQDLEN